MNMNQVNITKIKIQNIKELSDNIYRICNFCDKSVRLNLNNLDSCQKLSGTQFYCPFCLRHNHQQRLSRHVLPISFRGIIGYYYYQFYLSDPPKLYYSQIKSFIENHKRVGLQSPVFYYDDSNFMWYLNFNHIGNHQNKAPYSEVKRNISSILSCFKIDTIMPQFVHDAMYKKFDKAIELFYQQRKRPKNKKTLIPTLDGISSSAKNDFYEDTRNFTESDFILK